MKKETRFQTTQSIEIRAEDGQTPVLRGYAALYNSETDLGHFREVILPGAFTRTLDEEYSDIRALWNHDSSSVLGRTKSGTLKVEEDERGLKFELTLPDTTTGRDTAISVQRGDVTGMSFGFEVRQEEWERDGDNIRKLKDIELYEISPVTFPAYPDTTVAMRSLETFRAEESAGSNHRNASCPLSVERERQEMRKYQQTKYQSKYENA